MRSYNPANWYWIVAGDTTRAWSSAAAAYVPVSDATYAAWLAAGYVPTRIGSEADLQGVFAAQYPAGWPPTLVQQAQAALGAGLTIASASAPAVNGTYAVDTGAQANITSTMLYVVVHSAFPGGAATISWVDVAGAVHAMPSIAVFQAFATAVADYVAALTEIVLTGAGTLPAASVTIA